MEKTSKLGRDGAFWGLVMVAPTVIGLIVLNIYPFIDTIYMSFSKSLPFGEFEFEGIENYVETGTRKHPSKVDIGPINTMISSNFIDGARTRLSAQTTANLNPHFFLSGYYARGWRSRKSGSPPSGTTSGKWRKRKPF